ncbi:MAG: enolase C-terminal domain-like protein [Planctomycetota bacterium]
MKRREFLKLSGSACLLGPLSSCVGSARELLPGIEITRVVGFDLYCRRNKVAGKNAVKDVHGSQARDQMIRIYTNAGFDGIGHCRANERAVGRILGKNLKELYDIENNAMTGALGAGTMALWDLAGKVTGEPVYELLGGKGSKKVPVYDGSIYFADLLSKYEDNWQDRFRQEIDMGMKLGHRAFKVKIGRGHKWMPWDAGYARDKEVLEVIRRHAGPEVIIGVDSNNGYTLEKAKQLLLDMPDYKFAFMEEMFPETVEQCLEFKDFIKSHGWKTLVADGESGREVDFYEPFINARAVDVCQADMRQFGIDGIMTVADLCNKKNILIAPHNWGSLIGYYMQLQVGRAIGNFYRAEQDPVSTDVIVAEGYTIKDGYASVPAVPGFGLTVNEEKFASDVKVRFDLKA